MRGYDIIEAGEGVDSIEAEVTVLRSLPYMKFEVHPVLSVALLEEAVNLAMK